ncbi:MAG TPA: hypothetical protein VK463_13580 [Desulfomonilaceae bacterium]|nr:hypothetical protein [Desulfomonilaceae bacterium]
MGNVISMRSDEYYEALERREVFLSKHPELRPLQRKIDESLKKADTQQNRLVIMRELMMDSLNEMTESLNSMISSLKEFDRKVKTMQTTTEGCTSSSLAEVRAEETC